MPLANIMTIKPAIVSLFLVSSSEPTHLMKPPTNTDSITIKMAETTSKLQAVLFFCCSTSTLRRGGRAFFYSLCQLVL